jgi:hypothetical protein
VRALALALVHEDMATDVPAEVNTANRLLHFLSVDNRAIIAHGLCSIAGVRNLALVATPWSPKSYSLRTLLIWFGLAIFVPTTILAGLLFTHATSLERAQLESRVAQVAEDLTDDIDRTLAQHLTVLNTLAALPSLTTGDWPTFYAQAKAALQGKAYSILIDRSLRQLVNTRVPYGKAPSITGDPETARRMLITKQPAVSDLFFSSASLTEHPCSMWIFRSWSMARFDTSLSSDRTPPIFCLFSKDKSCRRSGRRLYSTVKG